MTQKHILILNGHPAERSLSHLFATSYAEAAQTAGHEVKLLHIRDLDFDPDYGFGGYKHHKPLEPDLEQFLEAIDWCDHFVLTTPMWWGGLPALLKGLIDRTFLPGRAFDTKSSKLPKPMLSGRTGQVIMTSDSPNWYFRILLHRPLYWQLKKQIFEFVGFKPVRITHFAQASHPKAGQVDQWVAKVRDLVARLS